MSDRLNILRLANRQRRAREKLLATIPTESAHVFEHLRHITAPASTKFSDAALVDWEVLHAFGVWQNPETLAWARFWYSPEIEPDSNWLAGYAGEGCILLLDDEGAFELPDKAAAFLIPQLWPDHVETATLFTAQGFPAWQVEKFYEGGHWQYSLLTWSHDPA